MMAFYRKMLSGAGRGFSSVGKGAGRGLSFLGSGAAAFVGLLSLRRIAAVIILVAAVVAFYRFPIPDNTIFSMVLLALALLLLARR